MQAAGQELRGKTLSALRESTFEIYSSLDFDMSRRRRQPFSGGGGGSGPMRAAGGNALLPNSWQ